MVSPLSSPREAAEVAEHVGRDVGLRPGLGADGVAGFLGDHAGDFLDARVDRVGDPQEHAAALGGATFLHAGKACRPPDRAVDVRRDPRHVGDGRPATGIIDGQGLAGCGPTQSPPISMGCRRTS